MANAKVVITAQSELEKGLNKAKYQLQDFEQAASTIGKSISSVISNHAGIAALVGSIAALGAAVKSCADEYLGVARENDRFAATMKNLSESTGISTRELQKLADAYEQSTFFSGEAVQAAGQLLLATEEISKDVFPRALQATIDLAEAMGQDVTSAASSMQKALAEPEEGLKSLRTAGINFTDEEENLIKSLVEANKKLEAQELILQKVEERYTGVAKAVGDTPAGKLDAIKDTWGNIKENLGQAFIDKMEPAIDFLLTKLEKLNAVVDEVINGPKEFDVVVKRVVESGEITNNADYQTSKQFLADMALITAKDKTGITPQDLQDAVNRVSELYGVNEGESFVMPSPEFINQVSAVLSEYEKNSKFTDIHTFDEIQAKYDELLNSTELYMSKIMFDRGTLDLSNTDSKYTQVYTLFNELDEYLNGVKEEKPEEVPDYSKAYDNFAKENARIFAASLNNTATEDDIISLHTMIDALAGLNDENSTRDDELIESFSNLLATISDNLYNKKEETPETPEALGNATSFIESFMEDAFVSTLDSFGQEIYDINKQITALQSIDIDSPFRAEADKLISDLIDMGDDLISKRLAEEEEANKKLLEKELEDAKKAEEEKQAEIQKILDNNLSFLEKEMLSAMDSYDREIYGIQNRIAELNAIDPLSPLKEEADEIVGRLEEHIESIKQAKIDDAKAEEEKKAAEEKSAKVKGILSDVTPAETEEDIYELFLKLDELAQIGTDEASEAMVRVEGYIADFYADLDEAERKRREEEAKKRAEAADIWETEGFSGLTKVFNKLEQEVSLSDVRGAFLAEFSRERSFDMGSLVGSLSGITDAAGPLLDILNSSDPLLVALTEIIEGFVSVVGPAIETTIAPVMDLLNEIGVVIGEACLPAFDALYPAREMVAEILRMFIMPCLQILEPILEAVAVAFDVVAGVVATVGYVLTPFAAALEFIMDMFSFLGECLQAWGENIGIFFYNLTHWANPKEYKLLNKEFSSDAFDNLGEKMDKFYQMMEDDSAVSDSVSEQIATTNATYTGATTVHMNIYQNAPVVGEDGMEQFAIMIRDKFEELNYYAA